MCKGVDSECDSDVEVVNKPAVISLNQACEGAHN